MWYKIDYPKLVVLLLPTFLRLQVLVAYLRALIFPLDQLYYTWYLWRESNLYKVEHTGQVCSLRKSLNDSFDPSLRRIYIGEGNIFETLYIYTEAEAQQVYVHTDAEEPTLWLRTDDETADTGLDFIVWVPQEIYDTQIHGLKFHIDFYKSGGKRYSIFIINE